MESVGNSVVDTPVERAKTYYDSSSADAFYNIIWGGEDIHIGFYENERDSVFDASHRTVLRMAGNLPGLNANKKILDIGSGYGGSARHLAKNYRCRVDCLNLSETQNTRNRQLNCEQSLDGLIEVHQGNFEALPFDDSSYDYVWCQDAILHSGNRRKVLEEVDRVLRPGGNFIFTDPMQSDNCPESVLEPVLSRIHLQDLGSPSFYTETARDLGWSLLDWHERTEHLITHYSRIKAEMEGMREKLVPLCGEEYIDRMNIGLTHWVDAGNAGHLCWGIFRFGKNAL